VKVNNLCELKKMGRNTSTYLYVWLGLLVLVSSSMIFSCQSTSNKNISDAPVRFDSVSPPVIVEANDFVINHLDTLPPPTVVMLSQRPAPVENRAGFHVTMQNFNTEDGLALSSILCSVKDQAGNLWFGTSGNGVSIYNGKSFTNYFSSHGLIHNFIWTITEDSKGNLWFGTYGGISKYDGVTFENFTTDHGLADNNVYEILEDKKGNIWFGTSNGISRYHPSKQHHGQNMFINYDIDDGLVAGAIIDIIEDRNGNLWFGGTGGVSKYNSSAEDRGKKTFNNVSKSLGVGGRKVNTITEDKEGIIWIGTDELLSRYDPDKKEFRHFTVADGLAENRVLSSMEDSKGNLWFGTKQGVSRYSKADGSFLNFTIDEGLADNHVESIVEDASGSLWFSTYGGGVSRYDGESVVEYSSDQGLPGKAVYAVVEDNKSNLWFAPLDGGIVEFRRDEGKKYGGTFANYRNEQGFERATAYTSVQDRNGNLWFGTAAGLVKFDGESFSTFTTEQGLQDDYINSLSTDRAGNLWIGTFDGGVSKFDGKSFTNFSTQQGLVHKTVWNIFEDNDGIIWIATRGGLSRYDGKQFMNFTTDQGLPDNKLSTLMQDAQGNLLTAGWGGGVSIIRKKHIENLTGTDFGQNYENIFEHFSTAEGLANDVVYNIVEDSLGNLIIGTSYGLTILKSGISDKEGEIAREAIEIYNENTGYSIKDVSHIYSLYKDSRGLIWAGTGDKLVRFDYGSVNKRNTPPNVLIQNIKINNGIISWHSLDWMRANDQRLKSKGNNVPPHVNEELQAFGRTLTNSKRDTMASRFKNVRFDSIRPFYAIPENLVLPYGKNNVSFEFVAVETARPELVRYRYKLEGYDSKWSPETEKATATFGNIFEGSYSFMVQAKGLDGIWSKPIIYSFKILPPWYRSWFAYLFYTVIFLGGVYSVHRFQKARTIRREREKTQKRELEQAKKIERTYRELKLARDKERAQAREIEGAYHDLEAAHKNLEAAQEQLVQQEKLASLGQLTAGIAHEIKNPLNFVNNFSDLSIELIEEVREEIERQLTKDESQPSSRFSYEGDGDDGLEDGQELILKLLKTIEDNLTKIREHGDRADRIVRSMLQHSRGGAGQMELTNLNAIVKEFVNLTFHGMRAAKDPINVDIVLQLDENVRELELKAEDFSRVLVNLCNNAFDAMREKAKEKNESAGDYLPKLIVRTRRNKDQVIVEIEDNGPGIPVEIRDQIMQPFFTTKKGTEGTGLGLYITNEIIKAHGGSMEIEHAKVDGTLFRIKLPNDSS